MLVAIAGYPGSGKDYFYETAKIHKAQLGFSKVNNFKFAEPFKLAFRVLVDTVGGIDGINPLLEENKEVDCVPLTGILHPNSRLEFRIMVERMTCVIMTGSLAAVSKGEYGFLDNFISLYDFSKSAEMLRSMGNVNNMTVTGHFLAAVIENHFSTVFTENVISPRTFYQKFGTELVRNHLHDSIWTNLMYSRLYYEPGLLKPDELFVITDLRFPSELNMLELLGGAKVYIECPEARQTWFTLNGAKHNSEANHDLLKAKTDKLIINAKDESFTLTVMDTLKELRNKTYPVLMTCL